MSATCEYELVPHMAAGHRRKMRRHIMLPAGRHYQAHVHVAGLLPGALDVHALKLQGLRTNQPLFPLKSLRDTHAHQSLIHSASKSPLGPGAARHAIHVQPARLQASREGAALASRGPDLRRQLAEGRAVALREVRGGVHVQQAADLVPAHGGHRGAPRPPTAGARGAPPWPPAGVSLPPPPFLSASASAPTSPLRRRGSDGGGRRRRGAGGGGVEGAEVGR